MKTLLVVVLAIFCVVASAIGKEPDNKDLSGLDVEDVMTAGENDAIEFYKDRPGLDMPRVVNLAQKFAILHNLRGEILGCYCSDFIHTYLSLDEK